MNPILIIIGAGFFFALVAAFTLRRRDPAFDQAVVEAERKQRIEAAAANRRDMKNTLSGVFIVCLTVAIAWAYFGFPMNGADLVNSVKKSIAPTHSGTVQPQ